MMDISKWAFNNRNLVYFLIAVLIAGGALSCYQMSKLEDPDVTLSCEAFNVRELAKDEIQGLLA